MKALIPTLTTAAFLIGLLGCNQDSAARKDMTKAAADTSSAVNEMADAAKQAGATMVKDLTKKAEEMVAPANAKAQEIIDGAKKLFNDGKLQESLAKLKALSGEKLSAEQQALAESLKAQIDKLTGTTSKATTDAVNAAGNLVK